MSLTIEIVILLVVLLPAAGVVVCLRWLYIHEAKECAAKFQPEDKKAHVFRDIVQGSRAFLWMWRLAAIMAALDIVYFTAFRFSPDAYQASYGWLREFVLGLWVLGPAIYFAVEYKFLYPGPYQGAELERHKAAQDVAAKLWAAVVVILAGLSHDWVK
jgi:hypothetical protein